ncbi:MAG: DUF1499 domain-containing protein [Gemmatimonadetes bacterium]|nr:DUF1499 domain-containing protein [Gemmatimonadota bacterium]
MSAPDADVSQAGGYGPGRGADTDLSGRAGRARQRRDPLSSAESLIPNQERRVSRLLTGLTQNRAETDPRASDERLRGRTYAIPFGRVWNAALVLCGGGLPRWSVVSADDHEGVIRARAVTRVFRRLDDVRVTIGLDENGQTRVDVASIALHRKRDLGSNARRIQRFLRALDEKLGATSEQILDPTRQPQFTV